MRPIFARGPGRGFTLVELLVVIAIIVILLALLVGGLERALKAAERSKCGANVRSIAQTCAAYALEYDRNFPVAKRLNGTAAETSMQVRYDTAGNSDAQYAAAAVGLGHLIVQGRLAGIAKSGEAIHCPSLDTTSGVPIKQGMDERGANANDGYTDTRGQSSVGGSYWSESVHNDSRVTGGYYYRALPYQLTRSGGAIRTNIAKTTFAVASDLVSMTPTNGTNKRYGRSFHHLEGWMVGYGDGHGEYVKDPNGPLKVKDSATGETNGYVESTVIGDQMNFPGPAATGVNSNTVKFAELNGFTQPGADEAVFGYFGKR